MENNRIGDLMEVTMTKIKEMVDVNTVVGEPITTPDGTTIVPISKVSFGFTSGASDFPVKEKAGFGGASGAGVKIEPVGFLIVKEGNVRMLNISPPPGTTLDRLVELVPVVIDRVEDFWEKRKEIQGD